MEDVLELYAEPYDVRRPKVNFDETDRKSTRLNSSHDQISYAVFCLKKKNNLDLIWGRRDGGRLNAVGELAWRLAVGQALQPSLYRGSGPTHAAQSSRDATVAPSGSA